MHKNNMPTRSLISSTAYIKKKHAEELRHLNQQIHTARPRVNTINSLESITLPHVLSDRKQRERSLHCSNIEKENRRLLQSLINIAQRRPIYSNVAIPAMITPKTSKALMRNKKPSCKTISKQTNNYTNKQLGKPVRVVDFSKTQNYIARNNNNAIILNRHIKNVKQLKPKNHHSKIENNEAVELIKLLNDSHSIKSLSDLEESPSKKTIISIEELNSAVNRWHHPMDLGDTIHVNAIQQFQETEEFEEDENSYQENEIRFLCGIIENLDYVINEAQKTTRSSVINNAG